MEIGVILFFVFKGGEDIIKYYIDVTEKWLNKTNTKIRIIQNARYVVKNGKRYYVNKINKIKHENHEVQNAKWFINIFGGKLIYLPKIDENGGISISDYKYYPNGKSNGFFLEEKETSGKSINVYWHALENKYKQSNIFLIDCTKSKFSNKEIAKRVLYIFKNEKTQYVKTVIIKHNSELFGVFERNKKRSSALR